ncbi:24082_t:CDS:1, partial [Racocetra persica]
MHYPPILLTLQILDIPLNNKIDLSFYKDTGSFKGFGNENHGSIGRPRKQSYLGLKI